MQIPAGEFKAKCLKLMERVARTREPIIITKRGRPVAKLMPPDDVEPLPPIFGYMAGTAQIRGDLAAPETEWAALTGEEDDLYPELTPGKTYRVAEPKPRRKHK